MAQKYFKDSDYSKRWLKAVSEHSSLNRVLDDCLGVMHPLGGESLLDIGVGNGRFIEPFLATGIKFYVGVDLSKALLRENRTCLKSFPDLDKQVFLIQSDAEHLPFRKQTFDKVICIGVFFFIPHMESFVAQVSKLLKKNGSFLTDFMDGTNPKLTMISQITKTANHAIRLIHRLRMTKSLLKLFSWLDQVPLLHLYEGWFTSYLTYGMTPFYSRNRANVLHEFEANNLKINKTFTNKSVFILASKN